MGKSDRNRFAAVVLCKQTGILGLTMFLFLWYFLSCSHLAWSYKNKARADLLSWKSSACCTRESKCDGHSKMLLWSILEEARIDKRKAELQHWDKLRERLLHYYSVFRQQQLIQCRSHGYEECGLHMTAATRNHIHHWSVKWYAYINICQYILWVNNPWLSQNYCFHCSKNNTATE